VDRPASPAPRLRVEASTVAGAQVDRLGQFAFVGRHGGAPAS
jgi:hypothetical protein